METQTLNNTIDQLVLIDIYRTFHPKTMNFTSLSSAHGTFSRIDHILGHKSSLGKFKKLKSFKHLFWSQCSKIRCQLQKKKKLLKIHTWRLNNTLLNNQQITEEINQNMHRNECKWKHSNPKPMGLSKSSAKGKVQSNTSLPQETRKKVK